MFCSNCGNELKGSDKYCSSCGQQNNKTPESDDSYKNTANEKHTPESKESNIWAVIIIISLIGFILVSTGVLDGFMDGRSSNTKYTSPDISPSSLTTGHYEIIVQSQWSYTYDRSSNEKIILNCYFDVTNIGTASADNVQVDYSLLFDGRLLDTSTIYLGTIPAGSNIHREKGHAVKLNSFEWNDLVDEEEEIEIEIDEIRAS